MQKMALEYAQRLLNGGYAFGNRMLSCHDSLLVVEYNEDDYPYGGISYYGTELKNGKLQVDNEGFVVFHSVSPIIDENTRFS